MHIVQALMRPIESFTSKDVNEALRLINAHLESRCFRYDLLLLTNRKRDLEERKEFENRDS